jgi:hypothetical protein
MSSSESTGKSGKWRVMWVSLPLPGSALIMWTVQEKSS